MQQSCHAASRNELEIDIQTWNYIHEAVYRLQSIYTTTHAVPRDLQQYYNAWYTPGIVDSIIIPSYHGIFQLFNQPNVHIEQILSISDSYYTTWV